MKANNMNVIIPQEIFLLERYASAEYFGKLRNTWDEMISHVDRGLNDFMQNLPPDYRKRRLPEQPDAVWGERVLPNFRDTSQSLNEGYIKLLAGDLTGLKYAHAPLNASKGQTDFWSGWMQNADENVYAKLLAKATTMAGNIVATEGAYWNPKELTTLYDERLYGALEAPVNWPTYKLSSPVTVSSGDPVLVSGIYVPDIEDSCAEFLSKAYPSAPNAKIYVSERELSAPDTGIIYAHEPVYAESPCRWTLVERVSDFDTKTTPLFLPPTKPRVAGGMLCPLAGFYFTPALENSRKHFGKGELMPKVASAYGETIWQWDANQDSR